MNFLQWSIFIVETITLFGQANEYLDFWPHHKGDIWQYRDVYTDELFSTVWIDSVVVDSLSKDIIVYEGGWDNNLSNHYRIDSLGNVYNRGIDSVYVRYKLYADSGDVWITE
jgi:hypothetical protein